MSTSSPSRQWLLASVFVVTAIVFCYTATTMEPRAEPDQASVAGTPLSATLFYNPTTTNTLTLPTCPAGTSLDKQRCGCVTIVVSTTTCGNGVCDVGETYTQCPNDCKCGNQLTEHTEMCDLGFAKNGKGKGCTADCKLERGWTCVGGGPSQYCVYHCGNGKIDVIPYTPIRESCDDKNSVDGDGCNVYCKREQGWSCIGEPSQCWRYKGL